ncbi:EamA family transporter [Candidatus Woesearchaeota archaeon]|nr:EamA family transporter [Candidatus Woesearchaeota archaeon]
MKKSKKSQKIQKTSLNAVIFMLFSAIFASVGQILFKFAANEVNSTATLIFNPFLYFGLLGYGLGLLFMIKAIRRGELTVVYPVLATSFIWVSIASPIFFAADSMNIQKWFGVAIIIIGITFVGKGRQK